MVLDQGRRQDERESEGRELIMDSGERKGETDGNDGERGRAKEREREREREAADGNSISEIEAEEDV